MKQTETRTSLDTKSERTDRDPQNGRSWYAYRYQSEAGTCLHRRRSTFDRKRWQGIDRLAALNTTLDNLLQWPVQRLQLAQQVNIDLLVLQRTEKNLVIAEGSERIESIDQELTKRQQELQAKVDAALANATATAKPKWSGIYDGLQRYGVALTRIREPVRHDGQSQARALSANEAQQAAAEIEPTRR